MSKKQAQFKKVDTWIDIVKNEHEVLDFWKSADIFNKLRSRNKGGKKWSFLDGPTIPWAFTTPGGGRSKTPSNDTTP